MATYVTIEFMNDEAAKRFVQRARYVGVMDDDEAYDANVTNVTRTLADVFINKPVNIDEWSGPIGPIERD